MALGQDINTGEIVARPIQGIQLAVATDADVKSMQTQLASTDEDVRAVALAKFNMYDTGSQNKIMAGVDEQKLGYSLKDELVKAK